MLPSARLCLREKGAERQSGQLRNHCLTQPRGGQERLHRGGDTWEKSRDKRHLPRAACGEQHSRPREQHVQRYRRREENGWSCPDPGMWVAEWEMTQKQVGEDNAEHRGKKERLAGTSDWGLGRKASHSLPELQGGRVVHGAGGSCELLGRVFLLSEPLSSHM